MEKTTFNKKVDSVGRITIPVKLRAELGIQNGDVLDFYIYQEEDGTYLCMKCPNAGNNIREAIELLGKAGYTVNKTL